ncbi:MAG: hypothetical protein RLZZ367_2000 [Bacteroidota bacterium]
MKSFVKYNWPSILWAAFILVLCLMPGKDLPSISLFQADKLGHFGVYLVLAFLMWFGWRRQTSFTWLHQQAFIKILLITSSYGFVVEILQHLLTTDRHFDLYDALANAIGAIAGSLISVKLFK